MRYAVFLWIPVFLLLSYGGKAQEVINLFNQKDLSGWYAFNAETGKHTNASDLFVADQQMIRLYGPVAGYLMSEQSYQNFRLEAEYRWNTDTTFIRKSDKKNSGIMYLVPQEQPDTLWPKGIQFQIKEGTTGDFILLGGIILYVNGIETIPGRSVTIPRIISAEKPFGEWNTLVITVENKKVIQELNGIVVNIGSKPSVTEGRILLQYEGYPIDFRNIILKKN